MQSTKKKWPTLPCWLINNYSSRTLLIRPEAIFCGPDVLEVGFSSSIPWKALSSANLHWQFFATSVIQLILVMQKIRYLLKWPLKWQWSRAAQTHIYNECNQSWLGKWHPQNPQSHTTKAIHDQLVLCLLERSLHLHETQDHVISIPLNWWIRLLWYIKWICSFQQKN